MTNIPERPFEYALNEQRTEATIEIEGTRIVVTAEQLENAIYHLGQLRARMLPGVPSDPANSTLSHQNNFLWIRPVPDSLPTNKGALLYLRSDGLGWSMIDFSPEDCQRLLLWLQSADSFVPPDTKVN